MELLPKIVEVWRNDRNKVNDSADRITRHVISLGAGRPESNLGRQTLDQSQAFFVQAYDPEHGGFGQSPKFPSAHQLSFLLSRYYQTKIHRPLRWSKKPWPKCGWAVFMISWVSAFTAIPPMPMAGAAL